MQPADQVNDYGEQIAARRAEEDLLAPVPVVTDDLSPSFIRSCLYNNERGDGILFATLHRDAFTHVKNSGQWLSWAGHHWQLDKADDAHNAVEAVAKRYLEQAARTKEDVDEAYKANDKDSAKRLEEERKLYLRRVDKLRSITGARNCLEWAHKIGELKLAINGGELDQLPMMLPCRNGVIDLRTGKLMAGRPSDYLLRSIPVDWTGIDTPCPEWERFIEEIHQNDRQVIEFVNRLFGYSITGLTTEHFIGVFIGDGRNGKGTMFEVLRSILGELSWAIQPELLLEQKNSRSSTGPSPDLISLHGRRFVIASESDEHRRVSGSQIKRLTGGDEICARAPHDRFETNFTPTHKLFLYTNHPPKGLAGDFALYKRLLYLLYPLKFVDTPDPADPFQRPRDQDLPARLRNEAPGILAWLVRGCIAWQEADGLNPPDKIRADIEALRKSEDTFQQFFDENVILEADGDALFKHLYDAYSAWYRDEISESDKYRPSKKAVSAWLEKRGYEKRKPGGQATVYGIRLACVIGDRP